VFPSTPLCLVLSIFPALLCFIFTYHNVPPLTAYYNTTYYRDHCACNPSLPRCYVSCTLPRPSQAERRRRQSWPSGFQVPLPWLILIYVFSLLYLGQIIFVVHRYTVVRQRGAKPAAQGEDADPPKLGAVVEKEIQAFLTKPVEIPRIETRLPVNVRLK
jgi:hypothetical protein